MLRRAFSEELAYYSFLYLQKKGGFLPYFLSFEKLIPHLLNQERVRHGLVYHLHEALMVFQTPFQEGAQKNYLYSVQYRHP